MGKGYNNYMTKKFFHPSNIDNIKRKWMAERKAEYESKKQEDMLAQYQREQEQLENRALLGDEKAKLGISFLYDAPPGAERSKEKEDNEPEYKFEWQRKYNAPREKYAQGNEDIHDQPFGIEVRNVRCVKCHTWGHVNTDRICPLFNKDITAEPPQPGKNPSVVLQGLKEGRLALTEEMKSSKASQRAKNEDLVESETEDPEVTFFKSLTSSQKKKLLKKLDKMAEKEKSGKIKKKKKKEKKKTHKKDKHSDDEAKKKKKVKRVERDSSSSSDDSTPERKHHRSGGKKSHHSAEDKQEATAAAGRNSRRNRSASVDETKHRRKQRKSLSSHSPDAPEKKHPNKEKYTDTRSPQRKQHRLESRDTTKRDKLSSADSKVSRHDRSSDDRNKNRNRDNKNERFTESENLPSFRKRDSFRRSERSRSRERNSRRMSKSRSPVRRQKSRNERSRSNSHARTLNQKRQRSISRSRDRNERRPRSTSRTDRRIGSNGDQRRKQNHSSSDSSESDDGRIARRFRSSSRERR